MPQYLAHIGDGTFAPLQLIPLLAIVAGYLIRARKLESTGRPVPLWRQACFLGGALVILAALTSPLAHVGGELFSVHMAQHLLLGDIAALLIVLGLTGPILQPLLAIRAVDRLRVLTNPLVALPLWAINLYVWHWPALYQAAIAHSGIHALEHTLFIGLGIAMWMPLFGPLPQPEWFGNGAKLIYIAVVRAAGAALANILIWSGTVLYPRYAPSEAYWGLSPLSDQGLAGNLMMIEESVLTICLFAWIFLKWARDSEEKQELLELADSRGVQLDERRAGRAVAAGRGEQLRARVIAAGDRGATSLTA